eukprot:3241186-Pyramimonas_sp.AAC.1
MMTMAIFLVRIMRKCACATTNKAMVTTPASTIMMAVLMIIMVVMLMTMALIISAVMRLFCADESNEEVRARKQLNFLASLP